MKENDYNVNWHMEGSPFYPSSSSNLPAINNFSGAVPEIQASQYHVVGNNNPRVPLDESRFCQYPTLSSAMRSNQMEMLDMLDMFSLRNNNNNSNNNMMDPHPHPHPHPHPPVQQYYDDGNNNGLLGGLHHHETDHLESAMSRLSLAAAATPHYRQSQLFLPAGPHDYHQFPSSSSSSSIRANNNSTAGFININNVVEAPAPASYGYFGNSPTTITTPEAVLLQRYLRIQQYASMGLQMPYYESNYFPTGDQNGTLITDQYLNNGGGGGCCGGFPCSYRSREISSDWKSRHNSNNHKLLSRSQQHRHHQMGFSSLEQVKGRVFYVAKDQHGCRFLQDRLVKDKPEQINLIFSEVKDNLHDLMLHQFGNYLIQKLIEVVNANQLSEILVSVVSNEERFKEVCIDEHGTRVVQKLLLYLNREQQFLAMSALSPITVALTKCSNGNHVIKICFDIFPPEVNKPLLDKVAANCLEIATDKSGCCILQTCVTYACDPSHAQQTGEAKMRLLTEIIANAQLLSEHCYGNYVVQLIILPGILEDIVTQLRGKYVRLCMNKYGSNVVEKCLKDESQTEQCTSIIVNEIVNSPHFLDVLQDPYGNYVAQSALQVSTGRTYNDLVRLILIHEKSLHSHPHGKRVLQQARASKQQRV